MHTPTATFHPSGTLLLCRTTRALFLPLSPSLVAPCLAGGDREVASLSRTGDLLRTKTPPNPGQGCFPGWLHAGQISLFAFERNRRNVSHRWQVEIRFCRWLVIWLSCQIFLIFYSEIFNRTLLKFSLCNNRNLTFVIIKWANFFVNSSWKLVAK